MTINRLAKSAAQPKRSLQEWCDHGNAYLRGEVDGLSGKPIESPRHDVEWVVQDGRVTIRWKQPAFVGLRQSEARKPLMDRRGQPMSESDTFALNKQLESLGATKRYRCDGSKYDA